MSNATSALGPELWCLGAAAHPEPEHSQAKVSLACVGRKLVCGARPAVDKSERIRMEAVATAAAAKEPDKGCTEPGPGHWGELSRTPVPSKPQDKVEAAEATPVALDSDTSGAENAAVSAMLHAVAASRLPVCSQQQGEPDLTEREKVAILAQLYHEKPLVFLERFRTGLREEHLACFGHVRGDHRADFYCAEVARQGTARPRTLRTRLRNRRYAALRELIQGGEYFSDEQMRFRAPLLYEQYIGQYLTQEELSARTPTHQPPKPGSPGRPACPLSNLLLQSYEERELQQRLLQQQEEEEACLEEEEEEEDSDEEDQRSGKDSEAWVPDSEERLILREEFTSRMHQRFLDGKDGDFDYRCSCAPTFPSPIPASHGLWPHAEPLTKLWGPPFVELEGPKTVPGCVVEQPKEETG
ncbi:PREDICTED: coiled-coil domain-containing protein 97 isoform X1 [Mandrillus leucophaeus]|uniref:coiled-coil domain-containing protein 97 isoform X1 n=1 Tax=Mandrillus leucophaeus TaxID=9568 RepID=UPI0005F544D4|nr:PREDICTED: coiled-coil domain-containing protein 97 isoform X1 [Mandrillus leucophaeus]